MLFSATGVALVLLAEWVGPCLPYVPEIELAAGLVNSLLNIIASSMLAVTTFSMSIIVGAYGSATSSVTPQATSLPAADRVAQNAVSVFIGSFLSSIVASSPPTPAAIWPGRCHGDGSAGCRTDRHKHT